MTTSPVKTTVRLTDRGRTVCRLAVVLVASLAILIERDVLLRTGMPVMDTITFLLSCVVILELLLVALLVRHPVKFVVMTFVFFVPFTAGCLSLGGAFS